MEPIRFEFGYLIPLLLGLELLSAVVGFLWVAGGESARARSRCSVPLLADRGWGGYPKGCGAQWRSGGGRIAFF